MRIAIIGFFTGGGLGSYAYRIASVLNHEHTASCYATQMFEIYDGDGMRITYLISNILGDDVDKIEYIIVIQSKILIHNDTDIPLLLFKTESVEPYGTVDNPTVTVKKLETMDDYNKFEHIVASSINTSLYNPNREKDILLLDVPWLPLPFEEYIERVERAQHLIIMQRVHDIDTYTCRVIEAMACKTIPIIFYRSIDTKRMYESIGITEEVAYFVNIQKYGDLQIREYDELMAQKGYELVIKNFTMKNHTIKFMEILLNG